MKGIFLALLAGALFAGYQLTIKFSANHLQELLGAVILQAIALAVGVVAFFCFREVNHDLTYSSEGIKFACLAGLFVGLAEIVSFFVFSTKISPSVGITLIVGTNILVGIVLDYFWLEGNLTVQQIFGIILVLLGVVLISWKS